ncbi:MAG: plastocyanin/azurin family copper-binding protein [Alphaproteobacteria bacterium]
MRPILTLAVLLVAGPALADAGHHHHRGDTAYGRPGDPKRPARTVVVRMRDEIDGRMSFVPDRIVVKRGEQIRFRLRNDGDMSHEMVIATLEENLKHAEEMKKNPDMEHDDPNARRLAPGKRGTILWRFTRAGEFDFSCLIPGHREVGMTGTIVVR